ncbi:MAG: hypothetical protein NVS3B15_16320 [Sediminibacterium sp.]
MNQQKQALITPLFAKENTTWMLIGGVIIALGFFLMSGGKSTDPNVFDTKQVYSSTRITVAPFLIVLGLIVEIYAIFKKPKTKN